MNKRRARLRGLGWKRWVTVGVVAMLAVGSGSWWLLTRGGSSQAASPITVQATRGTVKQTVSASGTVDAAKTADLDFTVSGTVTKVYVAEGDRVHRGQPLARIDDDALVATRNAAQASLDAARQQLSDDQDAGASDVQIAADQSAILSAQAQLADAQQAVKDAVLRSTITGTVASLDLAVGDVVGSGTNPSASATPSANSSDSSSSEVTVVSSRRFVVDATVSAADAPQVKKGLQADITVNGSSDTIYGTVSDLGLVAQTNSSGAAVFPVTIEVTGTPSGLYAGTSATATITVKQRANVLTVPGRAIRSSGGSTYVMKVVDGKAVKTPVTVGEVYGASTEIRSGLKDGDTVEVPGFTIQRGSGSNGNHGLLPGGGQFPGGGQLPGGMVVQK